MLLLISAAQIHNIENGVQNNEHAGKRYDRVDDTHGDSQGSRLLGHGKVHDRSSAVNHNTSGQDHNQDFDHDLQDFSFCPCDLIC